MSELDFESRLGGQLRTFAEGGVRPIDRYAIARTAITRSGARSRPAWRLGLRRAIWLPIAVGLLLAALLWSTAFVGGPHPSPAPTVTPSAQPTSGFAPLVAPPVYAGPFDAILLRPIGGSADEGPVDVVAVRADGTERVVRRLDDRGYSVYGDVFPDGWLAVSLSGPGTSPSAGIYRLINLARPDVGPRDVPYVPVIGGSWAPGGIFATTTPGLSSGFDITVTDANTGATVRLGPQGLPGGGPSLIWAADRSGILVSDSGDGSYGIAPLDGRPFVSGIPTLAPKKYLREWAQGAVLESDPGAGTVDTTDDHGGNRRRWYSGELGGSLGGASLSADGRSVWILVAGAEGEPGRLSLDRIAVPGQPEEVARLNAAGAADFGMESIAPDDSAFVLGCCQSPASLADQILTLVLRSGSSRTLGKGVPIGWVPSALVDTWPEVSPSPSAVTGSASPSSSVAGRYVPVGDMAVARTFPIEVKLADGRVLVLAGGIAGDFSLSELFDPKTGRFTSGPRWTSGEGSGVLLRDGRALVQAYDSNGVGSSLAVFDPTAMSFVEVGPTDPSTVRSPSMALLPDGRVLITGGDDISATGTNYARNPVATAEIFDPATDSLSPTGRMTAARAGHTSTTLRDGRVLIAGGDDRADAEIYDPVSGTFSAIATAWLPGAALQSLLLPDGRVLLYDSPVGSGALGNPQLFDPVTNTFAAAPAFPGNADAALVLDDRRVLLVGGTWAALYDPSTGATDSVAAPSVAWQEPVSLGDGRVLFIGGSQPSSGEGGPTALARAEILELAP